MTDPFESQTQSLPESDIQVWCASLNASPEDLSRHLALLSPDEKTRADRFHFERDRSRYIAGRGLLRLLLGNYLGLEPAGIRFEYGLHGKPALAGQGGTRRLEFNLSNSNEMAVYGFSWDAPLGIDIEYVRPLPDMDDFARRFFTPAECELIHSLSIQEKQDAFFRLWTCKEAYLKANGSGLAIPLDQVGVAFTAGTDATLIFMDGGPQPDGQWQLQLFTPVPAYQAALAFNRQGKQVKFQQLPGQ